MGVNVYIYIHIVYGTQKGDERQKRREDVRPRDSIDLPGMENYPLTRLEREGGGEGMEGERRVFISEVIDKRVLFYIQPSPKRGTILYTTTHAHIV